MGFNKLALAAAASALCCSFGSVATAASDTTPPTLNLAPTGTFVGASVIASMIPDSLGQPLETFPIPMQARWTTTDASGVCGSSTRYIHDDGYTSPWTAWGSATSLNVGVTDYDDQEGGGVDKLWGYDIRVQDCAGNTTERFVSFAPIVWQENGASYRYGTLPAKYSGTWSTSKCACWSGGTTKWTSSKAASVTFTLDNSKGPVPVGLVMETAPNRGKLQILMDGVLRATPDTYAATATHRKVVWIGTPGTGVHTITVKNLATSGRPRIDVDAFLTSQVIADPWRDPNY